MLEQVIRHLRNREANWRLACKRKSASEADKVVFRALASECRAIRGQLLLGVNFGVNFEVKASPRVPLTLGELRDLPDKAPVLVTIGRRSFGIHQAVCKNLRSWVLQHDGCPRYFHVERGYSPDKQCMRRLFSGWMRLWKVPSLGQPSITCLMRSRSYKR